MGNFVRVLIDSDPERELQFKVVFEVGDAFNAVTVEFRKTKADCIKFSLPELETLGYNDAKHLLQSALSQNE
jgi:hypothetical protein